MPEFAGKVLTNTGSAASGATIELYAEGDTATVLATDTADSSGNWSISHGTAGDFDVKITYETDVLWMSARDAVQLDQGHFSTRVIVAQTGDSVTGEFGESSLQVLGTTGATGSATIGRWSADASSPAISFIKSRNATIGSSTIVQDDDQIGRISFTGDDGTDFLAEAALISVEVDGTPGANDMPGRIVLSTTADGGQTPSERVRITAAGLVGIGQSAPDTQLHVTVDDASTNAVTTLAKLEHTTSGTAAAGIGVGVDFVIEDAGGGSNISTLEVVATNAGAGTEDADFVFKPLVAGTATEVMRVVGDFATTGGSGVQVGATLIVAPEATANDLVISSGATSGLSIQSTTTSSIHFGDAADADIGRIFYTHSADSLSFTAAGTQVADVITTGLLLRQSGAALTVGSSIQRGGTVHAYSGGSSATVNTAADDVVAEQNGNAGISILTPNSSVGSVYFGDPDDNDVGQIAYSHSAGSMAMTVETVNAMTVLASGVQILSRTDANRGSAGTAGRIIFNTDDGKLNIDDGTNWTLPDGTTT